MIAAAAARWGDRVALVAPLADGVGLSYRALGTHVAELAAQLAGFGVAPGRRVATYLPPGPTSITAMLAVLSAGVYAPLNPLAPLAETQDSLRNVRAEAIVCLRGAASPGRAAAAELGLPIIDVEQVPGETPGTIRFTCDRALADAAVDPNGGPLAFVLQTSGTTARPKVAPTTHRALLGAIPHNVRLHEVTPDDRCLHVVSPTHMMGITAVLYSMLAGASVIACPAVVASELPEWVRRDRPTWLTGPPAIHLAVIKALARDPGARVSPLRFIRTGASPMTPTFREQVERAWDAPVISAYAMSECPLITSNGYAAANRRADTVGRADCGTEVQVVDEDGAPLAPGEAGEVVIRGPHVITGYENAPEANAASFTADGWFRTGDLGTFDDDGFLRLVGRKKEVINRGGIKIAPLEVDAIVHRHPAIADAVAFAVPHPRLGETVGVAAVLRPGETATELEIRQHVAAVASADKVPDVVVFLDKLVTGSTGKPLRVGLAERLGVRVPDGPAAADVPYVAPAGPVEEALASIWATALGRREEPISATSEFVLDLGGDSFAVVAMLGAVERQFGHAPPPAALLGAPTLRDLAKLVADDRGTVTPAERRYVVPIQPRGDRPPLICLPGMFGHAFTFAPLARALVEQGVPVHAVQLPGVYGGEGEPQPETIDALVDVLLPEVRAAQPRGPYQFAGYSFGGYVALELTRRLATQGEAVGRVVMLDSRAPGFPRRRGPVGRARYHARAAIREGVIDYVRARVAPAVEPAPAPEAQESQEVQEAGGGGITLANHPIGRRSSAMTRHYRPAPYAGRVTVIRAAEQPAWYEFCVPDSTMGWSAFALDVEVHTVPGDHVSFLEAANVVHVAAALRDGLAT